MEKKLSKVKVLGIHGEIDKKYSKYNKSELVKLEKSIRHLYESCMSFKSKEKSYKEVINQPCSMNLLLLDS